MFLLVLQAVTKFIVKYFVETNTDNRTNGVNKSSYVSSTTVANSSTDPGSITLHFSLLQFLTGIECSSNRSSRFLEFVLLPVLY